MTFDLKKVAKTEIIKDSIIAGVCIFATSVVIDAISKRRNRFKDGINFVDSLQNENGNNYRHSR